MSLWFVPLFIARYLARKNRWLLLEGVRVRRLYLFSAGPFHWLLEVDRGETHRRATDEASLDVVGAAPQDRLTKIISKRGISPARFVRPSPAPAPRALRRPAL
jgi:hypothetical protein